MSHRGHHPEDPQQFGGDQLPRLREAVRDLSWLRTRGYGDNAAQTLVGDRYALKRRQRDAVARSACSDDEKAHRLDARQEESDLNGRVVHVDGFNVLITAEALLGGAYLFVGRDSALRDVHPVQGTYRTVDETGDAIRHIGAILQAAGASAVSTATRTSGGDFLRSMLTTRTGIS